MKFKVRAYIDCVIEGQVGTRGVKVTQTNFQLFPDPVMDQSSYIGPNGQMTEEGSRVMTMLLVQGIGAHIHACQKFGYRKDSEHVQYVVEKVSEIFASPQTEVTEGIIE